MILLISHSVVWLFETPWNAARQAPCPSLSPGVCSDSCPLSQWCYLLNHFTLCPLFILLPSIFPSIRVFSNESALLTRWPKCWSFSNSPSNEYSGMISFRIFWSVVRCVIHCTTAPLLISFRIDWFDFLEVQGTLKSLLQHHISKA